MHRYFDKLQSLGGAPGKEFAEFVVQMAHAAWFRMIGSAVGTAGVDVENALNPRQVLEVMHLLNTGGLLSVKRHSAVDVVRATADGAMNLAKHYADSNAQREVSTFESEERST